MYYKSKPVAAVVIEATMLTALIQVGTEAGHPGDWLLMGVDGKLSLKTDEAFLAEYEPADEDDYPTRFKEGRKKERKARRPKNGLGSEPLKEEAKP